MKIVIILTIISGIVLFFITNNIRNEEMAKLKKVEHLASLANQHFFSGLEIRKKYEEQEQLAQRDREFCRSIGAEWDCLEEKRQQREKDRKLCLALGKESNCLD